MVEKEKSSSFNSSNITNIAQARKQKKRAISRNPYQDDYTSPLEVEVAIGKLCEMLMGYGPSKGFCVPSFLQNDTVRKHFVMLDDQLAIFDPNTRTISVPESNYLASITELTVEQNLQFCSDTLNPVYLLNLKNCKRVHQEILYRLHAKIRASDNHIFKDIPVIVELSDQRIARQRLTYDIEAINYEDALKNVPEWEKMFARISDPKIICQFFYECLTGQGNRKTCLWLWGDRDAGKSTFASVLSETLGKEYVASLQAETAFGVGARFLIEQIYGKALVNFDDCEPNVVRSPIWKSLLGTPHHTLEKKYHDSREVRLGCRFIFTSNGRPDYRLENKREAEAQATRILEVQIKDPQRFIDYDEVIKRLSSEIRIVLGIGKALFDGRYIANKCENRIKNQINESLDCDTMTDFLCDFVPCKGSIVKNKFLKSYLISRGYTSDKDFSKFKNLLIQKLGAREVRKENERYLEGLRYV